MERNRIFLIFLFIIATILLTSCSNENPIGPAIRQTWGTYDYFSYGMWENWEYIARYPSENDSIEVWYYIFGTEYIEPYEGWQIGILIDGEPTEYYYLNVTTSEARYNYNPYISDWWLTHELPFIVGNKWHSESVGKDFNDVVWARTLDIEVITREDVSVIAGDYEDCVKLLMTVKNSLVDTTGGDSSYYYVEEEWYAPNVGLVKWVITETDVEDWRDASCILKKRYHRVYTGSSSAFQNRDIRRIDHWTCLPILNYLVH